MAGLTNPGRAGVPPAFSPRGGGTPALPGAVRFIAAALTLALAVFAAAGPGAAQQPNPPSRFPGAPPTLPGQQATSVSKYLDVPLVNIVPGRSGAEPRLTSPMANDPASVERGMQYFNGFNCVGCHAPNGGGGMGPALTSRNFIFGDAPAQHFTVIAHGAPYGMPAWADVLPENIIWDLVSYIDSISNAPGGQWGTTVTARADTLRIEQVGAEFNTSPRPWQATQPQHPGGRPPGM
jgi:cytochrome c oxidase cbb3-type subunit III